MKSIYTFIFSFIVWNANAQITLDQNDMPNSNTSYLYEVTSDLDGTDFSLTGPNYSWDFSSALQLNEDSIRNVSVGSTPFAYQLYFNNALLYPDHLADYASRGEEIDALGQVSISDRFDYYQVNSDALNLVGYGANVNGVPASVRFDTIDQIFPLPLSYQVSDSTSAYYLTSVPSLGTYGQSIKRSVYSDGYGSLITPYGNYNDVLRIRTNLYQTDTVFSSQFGFGTTIPRPVTTRYEWWEKSTGTPIMIAEVQAGAVTSVQYLKAIGLNVEAIEDASVNFWPQTEIGSFSFQSEERIENMEAFNINGQLLKSEWSQNQIKIEGSNQLILLFITTQSNKKYCVKLYNH